MVENLTNGEVREGLIPKMVDLDWDFHDGLTPSEKRILVGMPESDHLSGRRSVPNNEGLGDKLSTTIYDEAGNELHH